MVIQKKKNNYLYSTIVKKEMRRSMKSKRNFVSKNKRKFEEVPGLVYGNISNASTNYGEEKFRAVRGHGFAAERANTLYDKYSGHNATVIGDDNAKNGADRILNGVQIQSKYCKTGSKCISECFDNGRFRYWNADGSPMQIEVPSDKYEAAVTAMKERIRRNEVPGVMNPEEAENIVRKGHFTYEQVKNIAKAGTVESIVYDSANGAIIATSTFGVTALISFAISVWNGEAVETALKNAVYSGVKVGGTTFISAILAGQLSKAGLNSLLVGTSESLVKAMGAKNSAVLVNALRGGKNIYGAAAMKSASKMIRSNVITGTVSVVILSSVDVVNVFRKRISGKQLFKNVANTVSSVAGGTGGWIGGAAIGATVGSAIPGIGTAVGGTIGGFIGAFGGGVVAGKASDAIIGQFLEDDAETMVNIIENVFVMYVTDYLLTEHEVEHVLDKLQELLSLSVLKDMYAYKNHEEYAQKIILPLVQEEIEKRKKISLPDKKEFNKKLFDLLKA